jgi:hypothetical protein
MLEEDGLELLGVVPLELIVPVLGHQLRIAPVAAWNL